MSAAETTFDQGLASRSRQVSQRMAVSRVFQILFLAATCLSILALGTLLWTVLGRGIPWLSWHLITNMQ